MAKVYCKYCGASAVTIAGLTSCACSKNPHGKKHELYEGSEKSRYYCKYCGASAVTIVGLTSCACSKNPNSKRHEPAL